MAIRSPAPRPPFAAQAQVAAQVAARAAALAGAAACLFALAGPARAQSSPLASPIGPAPRITATAPADAPDQAATACEVPPDLAQDLAQGRAPHPGGLANTGRALHPGGRLDILAVGSGLVGPHLGADETFARRMLQRLRARYPRTQIQLDMQSDRGATAADLVAVLRAALERHAYALVLWQTGTVDAARRLRPGEFAHALADGLRIARAHATDVLLIDPQYSRLLESRADLAPYEAAIARQAASPGAALFPRFALMRHWVASGAVDIEASPRRDRRAAIELLHGCLADALAQAIATGATPAPAGVAE